MCLKVVMASAKSIFYLSPKSGQFNRFQGYFQAIRHCIHNIHVISSAKRCNSQYPGLRRSSQRLSSYIKSEKVFFQICAYCWKVHRLRHFEVSFTTHPQNFATCSVVVHFTHDRGAVFFQEGVIWYASWGRHNHIVLKCKSTLKTVHIGSTLSVTLCLSF